MMADMKLAVIVFGPSIVTLKGFARPVAIWSIQRIDSRFVEKRSIATLLRAVKSVRSVYRAKAGYGPGKSILCAHHKRVDCAGRPVIVRAFAIDQSDQRLNTHRVSGPPCGEGMLTLQFVPVVHERCGRGIRPGRTSCARDVDLRCGIGFDTNAARGGPEVRGDCFGPIHPYIQRIGTAG